MAILLCSSGAAVAREQPSEGVVDAMLLKPTLPARLRDALQHAMRDPVERAAVAPAPIADPGEEMPRRHVLLVEDNATNQMVMRPLLAKMNCQVVVAADGEEGARLAETQAFYVILMDLQMPVVDGLESTRRIRAGEGPNKRGTIIGLTAAVGLVYERQCRAAGMDDYLPKPVQRAALLERITNAPQGAIATAG
jgi:CheY-like chemotaxis protein